MERLYLICTVSISPVVALLADKIVVQRLSNKTLITLVLICLIIISPLIFTNYFYEGLYSNWLVFAIISAIIIFALFNISDMTNPVKWLMTFSLVCISLIPVGLILFAKSIVGEDHVLNTLQIEGYKIVCKRKADLVTSGPLIIALQKTALFGLLQKEVDIQYVDEVKSPCSVVLKDNSERKTIMYNPCNQTED